MMEAKGYLTADGRVVQDGYRGDLIGEVWLDVQRYNLRRVLVTRSWIVRRHDGRTFTGSLRREAIAAALERTPVEAPMD